jgi:MFS family permease
MTSKIGDSAAVRAVYRAYPTTLLQPSLEKLWFCQFCVGIIICLNNGACFVFGIVSPYMKTGAFQYSQSKIDAVSTVGVLLSYFSMPTGFLYDWKGPAATLLVGTLLNVAGWLGMYFIFKDMEHPLLSTNVAVMAFFFGLSQLSASFYETGSVLTNLKSFSCYQGRVILIQKTFMGLGSSLVAQIYIAFFEATVYGIAPFFAFLFLYSTVAGTLAVLYLRLPTPETRCVGLNVEDEETKQRGGGEPRMFLRPFNIGTAILSVCVVFVLVTSLVENFVALTGAMRVCIGVCTILLCVSFTSMIFTTPSYEVNRYGSEDDVVLQSSDVAGLCGAPTPATKLEEDDRCLYGWEDLTLCTAVPVEGGAVVAAGKTSSTLLKSPDRSPAAMGEVMPYGAVANAFSAPPTLDALVNGGAGLPHSNDNGEDEEVSADNPLAFHLNDRSLWENMRHRELWLLWFVCFGAWSAMTVVSSNSSQIYQALAYDSFSFTVNTVFVSIYGVASAVGRIIVGVLHPWMMRRRIPTSALLPLAPLLNIAGLPLFLVAPASILFIPFFIVGLGVGFSWGSTVLIITSFFTSNNCGKHYSFLYTAGMLSPLIFNMALFGPLYDHYGELQNHGSPGPCRGVVCIATPILVCTALNLVAAPLAYKFFKRTTARRGIVYAV